MRSESLFDRKLSALLLVCCLPLFFLPKVNLIGVAGQSAGLRIDDLFFAGLGTLVLLAHALTHRRLLRVEGSLSAIVVVGFMSVLAAPFIGDFYGLELKASLLYALRPLEYFFAFYLGTQMVSHLRPSSFIKSLLLFSMALMVLQHLDIVGALTVNGYQRHVADRTPAMASFPSEMGLLVNLMYAYLAFAPQEERELRCIRSSSGILEWSWKIAGPYVLFVVCTVLTIWTGNRISLLAIFVAFLFNVWGGGVSHHRKTINVSKMVLGALFLALAVVSALYFKEIYARSSHLFSWKNLEMIPKVWNSVDVHFDFAKSFMDEDHLFDDSLFMRMHKWCFGVKVALYCPASLVLGIGPGTLGPAVDGGWLRLLVEYGLLGFLPWILLFKTMAGISRRMRWVVLVFACNMIFFDAYMAYKVMSLLFLMAGSEYALLHGASENDQVAVAG